MSNCAVHEELLKVEFYGRAASGKLLASEPNAQRCIIEVRKKKMIACKKLCVNWLYVTVRVLECVSQTYNIN